MIARLWASFLACVFLIQAANIETRGAAGWPTRDQMRLTVSVDRPRGVPFLVVEKLPPELNPDSVRILRDGSSEIIPGKVDWRTPAARISWISAGAGTYYVYFDRKGSGETERLTAPAMVGSGDRITFGRPGVRGRLSVGLWAHPVAFDFDGDGNIDMIVSCLDHRYNGIYLFTILGQIKSPYSIGPSGWHRERRTSPSAEGRVIGPAGES